MKIVSPRSLKVIIFFSLDKGHEAKTLQKECLLLLYDHFPMEDSRESLNRCLFTFLQKVYVIRPFPVTL